MYFEKFYELAVNEGEGEITR